MIWIQEPQSYFFMYWCFDLLKLWGRKMHPKADPIYPTWQFVWCPYPSVLPPVTFQTELSALFNWEPRFIILVFCFVFILSHFMNNHYLFESVSNQIWHILLLISSEKSLYLDSRFSIKGEKTAFKISLVSQCPKINFSQFLIPVIKISEFDFLFSYSMPSWIQITLDDNSFKLGSP